MRVTPGIDSASRTLCGPAASPAWMTMPSPASRAMAKARANCAGGCVASLPARLTALTLCRRSPAAQRAVVSQASAPSCRTSTTCKAASGPPAALASAIAASTASSAASGVKPFWRGRSDQKIISW